MNRVVVTGMGIVSPNAIGLQHFRQALCEGRSGITHSAQMKELGFACQVGGVPQLSDTTAEEYLGAELSRNSNSAMKYAVVASVDCWRDAGLTLRTPDSNPDWDTAVIIGTCAGGADTVAELVGPATDGGRVRR